jgi:membrane peptidoglycan carboxypeptidase
MRRRLLIFSLLALIASGIYVGDAFFKAWRLAPEVPRLFSNRYIQGKLKLNGWLPLPNISAPAIGAIVASEDDDFYQHGGIELHSIKDAFITDLRHFRFERGASTITQQVVKNVFLNREKSIRRKIEEFFLARKVEQAVDKDRILEVYLNTAQFGEGLYGIGPASNFYFHKKASDLTLKEGAFLAMLLPSPVRYSQSFTRKKLTPYAEKTIEVILKRMEDDGNLPPGQWMNEVSTPLSFEAAKIAPVPTATPSTVSK